LFFGIAAPLLCLYFDPGLLRGNNALGPKLLTSLRLFAHLEMGISILVLAYYLVTRRDSSFLAGALYAGALFAFLAGILMLPLTLVGLFAIIGIPGLTPFFTAYVFWRNAKRCWRQTSVGGHGHITFSVALLAAVLVLGVPLGLQVTATHLMNNAIAAVQSGSEQDFARAEQTLRRLRFVVYIDTDRMARTYQRSVDKVERTRLARAFRALTGEDIENRLTD
jgi:hypothetical protein